MYEIQAKFMPGFQFHPYKCTVYMKVFQNPKHTWSQAVQVRDTCANSLLLVCSKCSSPLKTYVATLPPNVIVSAGRLLEVGRVRGGDEGETLMTERE